MVAEAVNTSSTMMEPWITKVTVVYCLSQSTPRIYWCQQQLPSQSLHLFMNVKVIRYDLHAHPGRRVYDLHISIALPWNSRASTRAMKHVIWKWKYGSDDNFGYKKEIMGCSCKYQQCHVKQNWLDFISCVWSVSWFMEYWERAKWDWSLKGHHVTFMLSHDILIKYEIPLSSICSVAGKYFLSQFKNFAKPQRQVLTEGDLQLFSIYGQGCLKWELNQMWQANSTVIKYISAYHDYCS